MWAHPGKKLLFMGAELGQWSEWNHDAELEWGLLEHPPHRGLQAYVRELNRLHAAEAALHACDDAWDGFEWLDFSDSARTVVSFVRRGGDARDVVVVANFAGVPWESLRLRVPWAGECEVLLDADEARWGGSGAGPGAGARPSSAGREIVLGLPALSIAYLAPARKAPARGGTRR
jgi:1,4-alpha-glucan branching enzyme